MSPTDPSAGAGGSDDGEPEGGPGERPATPPAPQSTETLVGQRLLTRYQIDTLIGGGIAGQVYDAQRLPDGLKVAIKVLDERHRPDPNVVRRFLREAEAARGL